MKKHFKSAIQNIAKFGDTDIFPFPIENSIFFDQEERTLNLLLEVHKEFDYFLDMSVRRSMPCSFLNSSATYLINS